jgi:NADH-quinone oxidoreductase subunit J
MFPTILFFIFASVLVCAALGVILVRNPVHSALLLVLCFFTSAVIWVLLDAEFLGIVLVLVYVGAVMVLFLFVVMMLDVNVEDVIVVRHLGGMSLRTAVALATDSSNTRALGTLLFTRYAYPAQLAACVLLVASVAAIVLTLRQRGGGKLQNIAAQVAVRAKDRVRIVKMASEKRP